LTLRSFDPDSSKHKGLLQNPMFCFFCTCGTPIKSDLSDMSDMSDQVPHQTLMQNQTACQY
ncbi:MAG: hypothetical protein IKD44_07065, partial [Lentisphaeria bacterium]|nr:hypothetical protein [Lentisphaeria bacterium]